jgi:hypothetical protein
MDHVALRRRVEASLETAMQEQLRAQQLIHDARNIRQRIAGRRFLKALYPAGRLDSPVSRPA